VTATRDDLAYSVRIQDKDLKRLVSILRQVKKEMAAVNAGGGSSTGAVQNLAKLRNEGKRTGGELETLGSHVGKLRIRVRGLGSQLLFVSGLGGLGGFALALKEVIHITNDAEVSQASLGKTVDNTVGGWNRRKGAIDAVIAAQQKVSKFSREDIRAALGVELRATKSLTGSYRLVALAQDVARGSGKSLATTSMVLAKVFGGNVGALKRIGIVIPGIKTGYQALAALQSRFGGQSARFAETTAGKMQGLKNTVHETTVAFGEGLVPALAKAFVGLDSTIGSAEFEEKARRLGKTVGTDVGQAVVFVANFVKTNWPTISSMFHIAAEAAKLLGMFLKIVMELLNGISSITPGGQGTLLWMLASGLLASKALKLAAALKKARTEGGLLAALTGAGEAGRLATIGRAGGILGASALGVYGVYKGATALSKHIGNPLGKLGGLIGGGAFGATHAIAPHLADSLASGASAGTAKGIAEGARVGAEKAKNYFGASLAGIKVPPTDAQLKATAAAIKKRIGTAFQDVRDTALAAFDAQTSILENRLNAVVHLGRTTFTVSVNGQTPAERELAALEKIQTFKQDNRDIRDKRMALQEALAFGDPRIIRKAQDDLGDALIAKRKDKLQERAKVERKAADAALETAKRNFAAERAIEKKHFETSLKALQTRLSTGKVMGKQAQADITATLGKYGVSLKSAGDALGQAYTSVLKKAIDGTKISIDRTSKSLDTMTSQSKIAALHRLAKAVKGVTAAGGGMGFAGRVGGQIPQGAAGGVPGAHMAKGFNAGGFVAAGVPTFSGSATHAGGVMPGGPISPHGKFGPGKFGGSLHLQKIAWDGLQSLYKLFGAGNIRVTAGYAASGHAKDGDHPRGLAVDLVPRAGWNPKTVALFDRVAQWAYAQHKHVRWVGWRGAHGHGPPPPWGVTPVSGAHMHISFMKLGGIAGKDSVPAMLTPGETILSVASSRNLASSLTKLDRLVRTFFTGVSRYVEPSNIYRPTAGSKPFPSLASLLPGGLASRLGHDQTLQLLAHLAQNEAHPTMVRKGKLVRRPFSAKFRAGGDVYYVQVDVHGHVTTEKKLIDAVHTGLRTKARRNPRKLRGAVPGMNLGLA
jgi:hypothetical protein